MRYEGAFEVPVSKEAVYSFVSNPSRIVTVIPDVVDSRVSDSSHFSVRAKAGIGPLKGVFDVDFHLTDGRPNDSLKLVGRGTGMQSSVDLALSMNLEGLPSGCRTRWVAEANFGGVIASLGGRLIQGAAENYVRRMTTELRSKIQG